MIDPEQPRLHPADSGTPRPSGGRFALGDLLGSGGMATVYRAWDRERNTVCAVKLLGEPLARDEEIRHRFRREASAVMSLTHERIVTVYDCGDDGPSPFIAMEYVSGGTVRDLLRQHGPLGEADALRLAAEVAEALAYAHGQGVVHRDIKPHNILLTDAHHVKVADFGIARVLDETSLTSVGSVLGSAQYLAPEQARGEAAGPAADQYALGVVLFELLTGRVPFDGDTPVAVALRHVRDTVPDIAHLRADLSSRTVEIVNRLLQKRPDDRFPTAAAAAAALSAAADLLAHAADHPDETAVLEAAGAPPPPGVETGRDGATVRLIAAAPGETGKMPEVDPAAAEPSRGTAGPADTRRWTREGRTWARAVAIAAAVLAVGAALGFAYRQAWFGAHSVVPSLIGETVQDAGSAVLPLNLGVKVTGQRQDPRVPFGAIIDQNPPPGREAIKGTIIELTVSEGSGTVPAVEGKPVAQAAQLLEAAGLRLGAVNYSRDDQVPAGNVIYQFEAPGTSLGANGAVDVLVSQGPPLGAPPAAASGTNPSVDSPAPTQPPAPAPQPQSSERPGAAAPPSGTTVSPSNPPVLERAAPPGSGDH